MSKLGQQLIEIVRRKASEQPGFVYTPPLGSACAYVHNGYPSCLIGHGLWGAGVIDASMEQSYQNTISFSGLRSERKLPIDESESNWLQFVQGEQDSKKSWSSAVTTADYRYSSVES